MQRMMSLLSLSTVLAFPAVGVADTSRFILAGTLQDGGTLTGYLDVNSFGENPVGITVTDQGYIYGFQGTFYEGPYFTNGKPSGLYSVSYDQAGDALLLAFPEFSLAGFAEGPLCSTSSPCPLNFNSSTFTANQRAVNFTTLAATSPVPEPGTFALVGTGLSGMIGAWRRSSVRKGSVG